MGAQRGLDVHVLDHNKGGPKQAIVHDLGASYHSDAGSLAELAPDILMECTGAPAVIRDCLAATAPAGIVCLTGVTEPGKIFDFDIGRLNRTLVLDNDVVFGTVNANRRHYEMAADALARADRRWLGAADHTARAARPLARGPGAPEGRHQGHHRFCAIGCQCRHASRITR